MSVELFHAPRRERGMCSDVSFYSIVNMTIGSRDFFQNQPFNSICLIAEPSLYEVTATMQSNTVHLKTCKGKWDWEKTYNDSTCESIVVPRSR